MNDSVKKYLPYAAITFAIYIVVPLIFKNGIFDNFVGVVWYFIFPATAAVSAAVYCSKYGMDFLFSLIAPILFLPSMFLYYGGITFANIILIVVYLVAGLFGLFIGDLALGDKRRAREKHEKEQAEELMLEAKRRDERELEKISVSEGLYSSDEAEPQPEKPSIGETDDFDYDKYISDIDRKPGTSESEIDDILSEYGSRNG